MYGIHQMKGALDVKKDAKKLVLNQETVKNLTEDELRKVEGGRVTVDIVTCNGCPPPAPPAGKQD